MPLLESPFAQLDLIRQPEQHNDPLQAFDAADEYLLSHLAQQQPSAATRVLVLNDSFGALAGGSDRAGRRGFRAGAWRGRLWVIDGCSAMGDQTV